jgi:hypothetical protein
MTKETKDKLINKHTSKVVAALVELGFYDFSFDRRADFTSINIIRFTQSPYSKIEVYHTGYVYYLSGDSVQFEGTTKQIKTIKSDILHKEK